MTDTSVKHHDLTAESIPRTLGRMVGGMMIGLLAMAGFHVTDTYFVSKLGTDPLAAMGFIFPVAMVIVSVGRGMGIGVSTLVSRLVGQRRHDEVRDAVAASLVLGLAAMAPVVVVGLLTIRPLFSLMDAPPDLLELIEAYMSVFYLGAIFVIIPFVGNDAIRGVGDTLSPSLVMVASMGLNIVLDPMLIFGFGPIPAMGIAGAAWATLLSRGISAACSLYILAVRKRMLRFRLPPVGEMLVCWKTVLAIGLPAGGAMLLQPFTLAILTKMVSQFGREAVAAFGAAGRVELLAVLPLMAVGNAMVPFVGQNRGAGRHRRIHRAHLGSVAFGLAWGGVCVLVLLLLGRPIASIFSKNDPEVLRLMALMLCIAPLAYGFKGVFFASGGVLNALQRPLHASTLMALRLLALTLPLAVAGAALLGYPGLIAGMVAAELLAAALSVATARRQMRLLVPVGLDA